MLTAPSARAGLAKVRPAAAKVVEVVKAVVRTSLLATLREVEVREGVVNVGEKAVEAVKRVRKMASFILCLCRLSVCGGGVCV